MKKIDEKFYLFGAGGHAKVVWDTLLSNHQKLSGCFTDIDSNSFHHSVPHLGKSILAFANESSYFNIAIGNNEVRRRIAINQKCDFFNVIHRESVLSDKVCIGNGNSILANATINPFSTIGHHCIINTSSIIEHDCIIENYVHISPNATLCGNVFVGEGTHIGAGAVVIPNIKIGKWATIGAGSVIINDIPDYAVVVGNPGKIIKYNVNER